MTMTAAQKRANDKWNKENMNVVYDHLHLVLPKGDKDRLKAAADAMGVSVNSYIRAAINEKMERGGKE